MGKEVCEEKPGVERNQGLSGPAFGDITFLLASVGENPDLSRETDPSRPPSQIPSVHTESTQTQRWGLGRC